VFAHVFIRLHVQYPLFFLLIVKLQTDGDRARLAVFPSPDSLIGSKAETSNVRLVARLPVNCWLPARANEMSNAEED
jgi:hypothetical protein